MTKTITKIMILFQVKNSFSLRGPCSQHIKTNLCSSKNNPTSVIIIYYLHPRRIVNNTALYIITTRQQPIKVARVGCVFGVFYNLLPDLQKFCKYCRYNFLFFMITIYVIVINLICHDVIAF